MFMMVGPKDAHAGHAHGVTPESDDPPYVMLFIVTSFLICCAMDYYD
jgi:hypothetical protein